MLTTACLVTADLGIVEYKICLHPPEDMLDMEGEVIPQPCKEGGSVSIEARSTRFAYWAVQPKRPLPRIERSKRVVLFYTPHNVWSLLAFPETRALEDPKAQSFVSALQSAIGACELALIAVRDKTKVNLGTYAKCIWGYYTRSTSVKDHTGLRGLAVVPEIVSEVKSYSSPGRSIPDGFIVETPVELVSSVRQQFSSNINLWVFANIPVVVSPLDCKQLLWDGCD